MSIWLGSRCVGISSEDSAQYNTRHSDARSACVRAAPVNTILLSRRDNWGRGTVKRIVAEFDSDRAVLSN